MLNYVPGTTKDHCSWLPEAQFSAARRLRKYSGLSVEYHESACVEGMVPSAVWGRGGAFGSDLIQGLAH